MVISITFNIVLAIMCIYFWQIGYYEKRRADYLEDCHKQRLFRHKNEESVENNGTL